MGTANSIFAYGTLNGPLLKTVIPAMKPYIRQKKKGMINARLFDLGEYPGARPTRNRSKQVYGQIYEVDPGHFATALKILDSYEEYDTANNAGSLYLRKLTTVRIAGGAELKAWVYWYNRPVKGRKEIESGDFKLYLKRNKFN